MLPPVTGSETDTGALDLGALISGQFLISNHLISDHLISDLLIFGLFISERAISNLRCTGLSAVDPDGENFVEVNLQLHNQRTA